MAVDVGHSATGNGAVEAGRVVRGTVAYAGGLGIAGAAVSAVHKELRAETVLGQAVTDADGAYVITYAGPARTDLVVRAKNGTTVLAESAVLFGAGDEETVDLTVDGGPAKTWSEFERLLRDLQPHLGSTAIADLADADVPLLAGKLASIGQRVATLVLAHKLAKRTGLAPEVHYGLARQGVPANLSGLLATEPGLRRRALAAAVRDRIIPGVLHDQLDALDTAMRAAAVKYGAGPAPMAKLLGGVLDQAADRETFLSRYAQHVDAAAQAGGDVDMAAFWTGLASHPRLGPRVADLQFTVQASALAGGHASLVNRLRAMRTAGEFGSARQLAKFTVADWTAVITSQPVPPAEQVPADITGPDQASRVASYARTLERILLDAMPTQAMAYRAQADSSRSAGIRAFWANVTAKGVGFELGAVKVETFLGVHPELLQGIADPAALTRELKATQRVFNLTARHNETAGLLDAGLTSASAIAKLSREDFVERHGALFGDADRAALVHDKAAHVAASAMATVAAYSPQFNSIGLATTLNPTPVTIPTIATLFGSLDTAACEHCRSVASPAAYYAEVLEFLSKRPAVAPNGTALNVLLKRRPDLTELELTCANTNTELPYLDLVNEVLENAIAPFAGIVLPLAVAADLDARRVPETIKPLFAQAGYPLTPAHLVVVAQAGKRWLITDSSVLFDVRKTTASEIRVVAAVNQTGAGAARLAASPEHVNTAAYDTVRSAIFPLSLPLDLWRAETTTFLGHLGVDRATLMTELSAQSPWTALTRPEVVAEWLGISSAERSVLTGGTPVKLASTSAIPNLAGTVTVDGVATSAGQLILVKDQLSPAQNGVYLTTTGSWIRRELPGLLTVTDGTANKNTSWRLEPASGAVQARRVQPWDYYGLAQNGNPVGIFTGGPVPQTVPLDWLAALTWVPTLLDRLAVSYEELIALLSTGYVNLGGTVRITSADTADPTTTELWKLKLTGTGQPLFDRLHLFVRLWRRLGWSPAELDAAIAVLQGGIADPVKRISDALLRGCLHVDRLAGRLGLSREQVLTFWSPLPTTGTDPLYRRLFANPAVVNPVDPNFALVGNEIAVAVTNPANARIAKHTATLVAALGVSTAELTTLAAALVPSDTLNLASVSLLYRHVLLARGLGLPVRDLLALIAMTGLDPFAQQQTVNAVRVVELAERITSAGTTIAELDYLLNHRGTADWAPSDVDIASALAGIRVQLRALREETEPRPDPEGELTRGRLTGFGWSASLVDELLLALTPQATYSWPLAVLPANFQVPAALAGRVSWADRVLTVVGPLTIAEREALKAAAPGVPADYLAAVKELFAAARKPLRDKAIRWPTFHVPLAALPAGLQFPAGIDQRIYHDPSTQRLCLRGAMSAAEHELLLILSPDTDYRAAVTALRAAAGDYLPEAANTLLSTEDIAALLDVPVAVADRYALVLARVLRFARDEVGTEIVVQRLAEALAAPAGTVRAILTTAMHAGATSSAFAIADLVAEEFQASHPDVPITPAAFGQQIDTYRRLAKVIRLIAMLRLRPAQLAWLTRADVPSRPVPWLTGNQVSTGWLRPDHLPVHQADRTVDRFAAWLRLAELAGLRDRIPGGADTVDAVHAAPTVQAALTELAERTGWVLADLTALCAAGVQNLNQQADFRDETGMSRLLGALRQLDLLGGTVAQCVAFTAPALTAADGRTAVSLVKARYTEPQWSTVARPLRDTLREAQRDALVAYLVSRPDPSKGQTWTDTNGLYGHFLIDSQMSARMTTSRLKQAISSAQLFIQRCQLNLETGPNMNNSGWKDWEWMKNYRVWEAGRKVFLYPENWIDPELRTDKSPLFLAAEAELAQDDVTSEAAERVVANYIRGLMEVARLEPAGMYRANSTTYLFGRTTGTMTPSYYQRVQKGGRWTAWERVDLDISSSQIMPVVWRRRLFLFWPVFTEEIEPVLGGSGPPAKAAPTKWRIQLAWSEYSKGKWLPRNVTNVDQQGMNYNYTEWVGGHLETIHVYHAPYEHVLRAKIDGDQLFVWPNVGRNIHPDTDHPTQYAVRRWHFTHSGPSDRDFFLGVNGVAGPSGTQAFGSDFIEYTDNELRLPKLDGTEGIAFAKTTGLMSFRLSYPHQYDTITGSKPFLFNDDLKTYLVVPRVVQEWVCDSVNPARADPGAIDVLLRHYYRAGEEPILVPRWGVPELPPAGLRQDARVPEPDDSVGDGRIDEPTNLVAGYQPARRYEFQTFFHPFGPDLLEDLLSGGATKLLSRSNQLSDQDTDFDDRYEPASSLVYSAHPKEDIDFGYGGGYSIYNWELFFHLPLLIAARLTANQRFEEARRWLHLIFNPTDTSSYPAPRKYWQTKPLHLLSIEEIVADRIDQILAMLAGGEPPDGLLDEVGQWRNNPFDPHAVARLRPTAYAKNVVMRYLDNLIAWGDQLFRRDTVESINEATQLYILAAQILGPKPAMIPPRATPQVHTHSTLDIELSTLSNDLVDIEYLFGSVRPDAVVTNPDAPPVPLPQTLYFGIPANDKLLGYWDTVADRLFKIRHSMNIEGAERALALFEPPVDPALLVAANAAGADIGSAIADAAAPLPVYRFRTLAAKATELAQQVQSLGANLLQVLDRRDAEDLAALRAGQESELLRVMEQVRIRQHEAAIAQTANLRAAREQAMARYVHYQRMQGVAEPHRPAEGETISEVALPTAAGVPGAEGTKMIASEKLQLDELGRAQDFQKSAHTWEAAAILSYYIPDLSIATLPWGVGGSVKLGISGSALGPALQAMASRERAGATRHGDGSNRASIIAGLVHRETEAVLQQNLAAKDITHMDTQLTESAIREQVAKSELDNHRTQLEQARGTEEFLRGKYTNAELYNWMIGRVAQAYFTGYQLAHDMARRAERAYRFELGLDTSDFVSYGYWDSLRKGLLAAEGLQHDIQRMHMSYLDLNKREHELTKHVSLASLHPEGLVALRRQGSSYLELPEAVFDLDQPGHYRRRIKSVAVTIACTTGPYTGVNAKLTLLANRTRVNPATSPAYRWTGQEDQRFRYDPGGVQSIVTSSGDADGGMFEANLDDERYLPFEGAGAVSSWRIELPETFRQFDYDSITDVILHLRYTARDAGGPLRVAASADLADAIRSMPVGQDTAGLFRMISARTELGDAWPRFLHPGGTDPHSIAVPLGPDRFPAHVRDRALKVTTAAVFVRLADGITYDPADRIVLRLTGPGGTPVTELPLLVAPTELGGLPAAMATLPGVALSSVNPWRLEVVRVPTALGQDVTVGGTTVRRFAEGVLADVGIVWGYTF